ncbi:hypothetical protein [Morganella psychrotolerans]|uniref:Uncharacterized protein n=1 Tax=Morganella psychrotolerans TaxID=368603 RepID=A0A1B8H724_9GAMM|nr:hypothetical protein [Morganella psychrotolerans]OBU04888.1 hypothetical protein AYY17_08335 [Morganella psychrotolerans]
MFIEDNGTRYEIIRGSDVVRDGMYLELSLPDTYPVEQLAEIFYSDVTHDFIISIFADSLPLSVIEILVAEAKVLLPLKKPLN